MLVSVKGGYVPASQVKFVREQKGGAKIETIDGEISRATVDGLCHVRGFYLSIARGALSPHVYISMP
jgi:hypothetical protein